MSVIAGAGGSPLRPSSAGRGLAFRPEQPAHVVDQVGEPDLGRRPGQADRADEQAHPGLLLGEDVLDLRPHPDFLAFARAVRAGIGRSAGFLRWMRLTNMRSCSSSSFFFER